MELKQLVQSKIYIIVALSIAAIAVLFFTFGAGMYVGFHKARFSYQWGENYHKNFGGPRGGLFRDFGGKDLIDANGVAGQIMKINPATGSTGSLQANSGQAATLVIKGRDNVEKIILVKEDTIIRRFTETIKLGDLKVDNNIVAIGEPNDQGQIEAKFIRTLPTPMRRMP